VVDFSIDKYSLFAYYVIKPAVVLQYFIMFWLLRVLIVKEYFVFNKEGEAI